MVSLEDRIRSLEHRLRVLQKLPPIDQGRTHLSGVRLRKPGEPLPAEEREDGGASEEQQQQESASPPVEAPPAPPSQAAEPQVADTAPGSATKTEGEAAAPQQPKKVRYIMRPKPPQQVAAEAAEDAKEEVSIISKRTFRVICRPKPQQSGTSAASNNSKRGTQTASPPGTVRSTMKVNSTGLSPFDAPVESMYFVKKHNSTSRTPATRSTRASHTGGAAAAAVNATAKTPTKQPHEDNGRLSVSVSSAPPGVIDSRLSPRTPLQPGAATPTSQPAKTRASYQGVSPTLHDRSSSGIRLDPLPAPAVCTDTEVNKGSNCAAEEHPEGSVAEMVMQECSTRPSAAVAPRNYGATHHFGEGKSVLDALEAAGVAEDLSQRAALQPQAPRATNLAATYSAMDSAVPRHKRIIITTKREATGLPKKATQKSPREARVPSPRQPLPKGDQQGAGSGDQAEPPSPTLVPAPIPEVVRPAWLDAEVHDSDEVLYQYSNPETAAEYDRLYSDYGEHLTGDEEGLLELWAALGGTEGWHRVLRPAQLSLLLSREMVVKVRFRVQEDRLTYLGGTTISQEEVAGFFSTILPRLRYLEYMELFDCPVRPLHWDSILHTHAPFPELKGVYFLYTMWSSTDVLQLVKLCPGLEDGKVRTDTYMQCIVGLSAQQLMDECMGKVLVRSY